jgi:hypothetical protein
MSDFVVKDSGKREDFPTGAVRDTEEGKPRYDLISIPALTRLAHHLRKGAEKYSTRNWEKGLDYSRLYSSAFRHLMQWADGNREEDHLAAVLFNVMALVHFDELGRTDLDDMVPPKRRPEPKASELVLCSCGVAFDFFCASPAIGSGPDVVCTACCGTVNLHKGRERFLAAKKNVDGLLDSKAGRS